MRQLFFFFFGLTRRNAFLWRFVTGYLEELYLYIYLQRQILGVSCPPSSFISVHPYLVYYVTSPIIINCIFIDCTFPHVGLLIIIKNLNFVYKYNSLFQAVINKLTPDEAYPALSQVHESHFTCTVPLHRTSWPHNRWFTNTMHSSWSLHSQARRWMVQSFRPRKFK
jgi:hypothetical protein